MKNQPEFHRLYIVVPLKGLQSDNVVFERKGAVNS